MKRRSPWLAFAACALLRGGLVAVEPGEQPAVQQKQAVAEKPALSISGASAAAENELRKRGLADTHIVTGIALVRSGSQPPFYSAMIEPPIPATAIKGAVVPAESPEKHLRLSTSFKIDMSGTVTVTTGPSRRVRVSNPAPK